jgi:DNA gyrase subunit B
MGDLKLQSADGETIDGARLREVTFRSLRYRKVFSKIQRRGDPRVLDMVIKQTCIKSELLNDEQQLAREIKQTREQLEKKYPEMLPLEFILEIDEKYDCSRILCETRVDSAPRQTTINKALLDSPEFNELRAIQTLFSEFGRPPFKLQVNGEHEGIENLEEIIEHVEKLGRKGIQIQRYKGLGEMNPEQLWETTMNPDTRTLLQVKVEDTMDAEDVFTVLMGNQVEPRREFIEQNALQVRNLDI